MEKTKIGVLNNFARRTGRNARFDISPEIAAMKDEDRIEVVEQVQMYESFPFTVPDADLIEFDCRGHRIVAKVVYADPVLPDFAGDP